MARDILIITLSILDWLEPSDHINHPLTAPDASRHYPRAQRQALRAPNTAANGGTSASLRRANSTGIMPKMSSKRAHEIPTRKAIYHTGHLNSSSGSAACRFAKLLLQVTQRCKNINTRPGSASQLVAPWHVCVSANFWSHELTCKFSRIRWFAACFALMLFW